MNTNNSHSNDFGASLPLPENDRVDNSSAKSDAEAAADLIRKKVQAAYSDAPDVDIESEDVSRLEPSEPKSRHQRFIYELTSSGKPLEEIQAQWHDYYAALTDVEKHTVWQEFYSAHAKASHYSAAVPSMTPNDNKQPATNPAAGPGLSWQPQTASKPDLLDDIRRTATDTLRGLKGGKSADHLRSLVFGLGVGGIVLVVFLFSFFNERFIAPFIQPSRTVSGTPIIGNASAVTSAPEVIIPKINVEIPVVYGVNTIDNNAVEAALEDGVVHYADTADPGQNGNLVIVGHSSNNIFNKGKYKFAFVLLSHLENGDTFYVQKDGKRYTYEVYKKTIVSPDDVSVLGATEKPATATLITCDPPGTSTNRLVVVGQQISPDPTSNLAANGNQNTLATTTKVVPGNAPSLWSRLTHFL